MMGNLIVAAAIYGGGTNGFHRMTWGWALVGEMSGAMSVSIVIVALRAESRRRPMPRPRRLLNAVPYLVAVLPAYLLGGVSPATAMGWVVASFAAWVFWAVWLGRRSTVPPRPL